MRMIANETNAKMDMSKITEEFVNRSLPESRIRIVSANRLFKKWARIGTRIFSVFRYRTATQIPKTNAEKIDPKP